MHVRRFPSILARPAPMPMMLLAMRGSLRLMPGTPVDLTLLGTLVVVAVVLAVVAVHTARRRRDAEALAQRLAEAADAIARSEAALRASEERYALASRGANDGLWDWDVRADRLHAAARFAEIYGVAEAAAPATRAAWATLVHPADLETFHEALDAHLAGRTPRLESEHRARTPQGGSDRWVLCRGVAVRDAGGAAYRVAGSVTDVTARKDAEARLRHGALHDPLTGLPNRALFTEVLDRTLARARRSGTPHFAVLFVDLDRFKVVNDTLGHAAGDELLAAVARRLEVSLRPGDTVARLGGDEFTVVLADVADPDTAVHVVARVQEALARPFDVQGQQLQVSASVGVALYDPDYEGAAELLQAADLAMYRAKARGIGQFELSDPLMRAAAQARLQLEADLRRALERGELLLHYQPIAALATGKLTGFEALVRWNHPARGMLNAASFVPIAEETGMIVAIGRFVLAEACRQTAAWQRACGEQLTIAVNLSTRELLQPGLVAAVGTAIQSSGLPPETLQLEITESALLEESESSAAVLAALHALGVRLHLDDFGTGYSSLSYLHRFPIHTVKIDRYFVSKMTAHAECYEIVRSVIGLARSLGMDVIAEGAETEAQVASLRALACSYTQGYGVARPLSGAAAAALLAGRAPEAA